MVSHLLRGLVVLIGVAVFIAFYVTIGVPLFNPPDAEGPYRKERPGRCVCR